MKKLFFTSVSTIAILLMSKTTFAQTCSTPPSCATLGYTKSSSDCSGQPMLKCPLDTTKVFCASSSTTTTTPTTPTTTYSVGDYYYYNNNAIGKVIAISGTNLTVARAPSTATDVSPEGLASYCSSLSTASAVWSPLATEEDCSKAADVWDILRDSSNGTIISSGDDHYCSNNCICYSSSSSYYTYHYVCVSTFKV